MTAIEFAGPLPSSPVATLTQARGWVRGVFGTGVYPNGIGLYTGGFACSDGGSLNVTVAAGEALVDGVYATSTGNKTVTLATADVTNPRIDLIVLRLDPTANGGDGAVTLEAKTGTPAGSPVAPTVTQSASGTWETALATVAVAASSAVLGTITDVRTFVAKGNSLLSLGDTPALYAGKAGKILRVNTATNAIEFGGSAGFSHADAAVSLTTSYQTVKAATMAAGEPAAGDVYRVTMFGDLLQNSGASRDVAFQLTIGSTTLLTSTAFPFAANANTYRWRLTAEVAFVTSSSQRASAALTFGSAASAATDWNPLYDTGAPASDYHVVGYNTAAESSAGALAVNLQVKSDANTATQTMTCRSMLLERVVA